MQSTPSLQQMTSDIRAVLPDAQAAWLYGSGARGELRADSDLDVAVLFGKTLESHTGWALQEHAESLSARWNRDVDLVNLRIVSPVLQKEVIDSRKRLFALDEFKTDLYELAALAEYREYNERNANEFERIAATGKVRP